MRRRGGEVCNALRDEDRADLVVESLNASPLVRLPQELRDLIVVYLVEVDILALAITCSCLFRLLGERFSQIIRTDCAPWAGDRLLFVGDCAGKPLTGVASATEIAAWEDPVRHEKKEANANRVYLFSTPDNEGDYIISPYEYFDCKVADSIPLELDYSGKQWPFDLERTEWPDIELLGYGRYGTHFMVVQRNLLLFRLRSYAADRCLFLRLCSILGSSGATNEIPTQGLLRNLTVKQYVRHSVIAASGYIYSFGEVSVLVTVF